MQIDSEEELQKKAIKELKKNLSCVEIATNILGLTIEKSKSNKRYLKTIEHSSMVFDLKENIVYWNARSTKPYNIIDFYIEYTNNYPSKAIVELLNYYNKKDPLAINNFIYSEIEDDVYMQKELILPKKADNNCIVIDYLINRRKLDEKLVYELIESGRLFEDVYHNAVFVGYDVITQTLPIFATRRGTGESKFQRDCSGSFKTNGFYLSRTVNCDNSDSLYIFESVIDGLSFLSLNKDRNIKILCSSGCAPVLNILKYNLVNNPELRNIKKIELLLDNDEAGQISTKKVIEQLSGNHFSFQGNYYPTNFTIKKADYYLKYHNEVKEVKDLNELLKAVTYLVRNNIQTKEESFIFLGDNSTKKNSGQIEYENTDLIYGNINVLSTEQEEDELEL